MYAYVGFVNDVYKNLLFIILLYIIIMEIRVDFSFIDFKLFSSGKRLLYFILLLFIN